MTSERPLDLASEFAATDDADRLQRLIAFEINGYGETDLSPRPPFHP